MCLIFGSTHGAMHSERAYFDGWIKGGMAPKFTGVVFTVAVKEQGIDEVKRIAREVSDPLSRTYGNFMNQEDLEKLTAPKASNFAAVVKWLDANGADYAVRSASIIDVITSVEIASKMLRSRFHAILHSKQNKSIVRATDYSLPLEVEEAVAAIFGLHGLPLPSSDPFRPIASAVEVTPSVLASTYNISGVSPTGSFKNRQAVAEFQGQLMSSQDLSTLFQRYVKDYRKGTDDAVSKYVGAAHTEGEGVEAELDIQYIMSTAVGIRTE
jgi:tripeptidyl-peptidase-1